MSIYLCNYKFALVDLYILHDLRRTESKKLVCGQRIGKHNPKYDEILASAMHKNVRAQN